MADDLGAVRRTPRPTPHPRPTDDHQTPETVAQPGAGTTNDPTLVSQDAENATGELSASAERLSVGFTQVPPAAVTNPGFGCLLTTDTDDQAYAELPECEACDGSGKDDHATVFEAPLAVHFAGPTIEIAGRRRQLCMWCGHVLRDLALADGPVPPWADTWPVGKFVHLEDGVGTVLDRAPHAELPPGCCALPDDEPAKVCEPCAADGWTACEGPHTCTCKPDRCDRLTVNGQCQRCARLGPGQGGCPAANGRGWTLGDHPADRPPEDGPDEAQETRAAADWPTEAVDTPEDGDQ